MLAPTIQIAGLACIVLVSLFSLVVGGRPERVATIASVSALVISLRVQRIGADTLQIGVLAVDLVLLGVFFLIAFLSKRHWVLWTVSFQLLAVATHVGFIVAPSPRVAYLTLLAVWSYVVVGSIGVGAALHLRGRLQERHKIG